MAATEINSGKKLGSRRKEEKMMMMMTMMMIEKYLA